ncbi:MAG: tetratricopeptide repeat protein [Longimicrobiales bacterium]
MSGIRNLSLAFALVFATLVAAAATQAQEPKDSKYTEDAEKFLGLAMIQQDPAQREQMYRDALEALQGGFEEDAENPKFWLTAGQVYAGLGDIEKASEAFNKATEMHPPYEEEIEGDLEAAWMAGFERGVAMMDRQSYDSALVVLDAANALYPNRPEGWLNIGSIYANNKNDIEKAVHAFEMAMAAVEGPLYEQIDSASQAQWQDYAEMSAVNIAQMRGVQGVTEFEAERFEQAEEMFRAAVELNPYSRDYLFNIVQSQYAQTTDLEEQLEADSTVEAELGPQLIPLYEELRAEIEKVKTFDPNNEALYMIEARALRRENELKGDTLAAQQGAMAVLEAHQALPVDVDQVSIVPDPEGASAEITGQVRTRSAAPGSQVTIRVTLLDRHGETIGRQDFSVTVPEADQTAPFGGTAPAEGSIAGWKYEVVAAD